MKTLSIQENLPREGLLGLEPERCDDSRQEGAGGGQVGLHPTPLGGPTPESACRRGIGTH